ncbi:MAG: ABC transporter ATP-binding protein [Candidatus Kapabacteria bacterium]|nr:ABC transporter ATP-binding protein [Candidatus Kapabacteria bacterium]
MTNFKYDVLNISKYFIRNHYIFRNLSLSFTNGNIIAITGANGSGKSTLLKVMTGVLSFSSGNIKVIKDGLDIHVSNLKEDIAMVSPYLNLYEEFTPYEHYKISADLRGIKFDENKLDKLLQLFKLRPHKNSPIRNFSSGMKQRMKFILALQSNPTILFLDEPTSNLDADGIESINKIIIEHAANGGAVIIATNEEREKSLCSICYEVTS